MKFFAIQPNIGGASVVPNHQNDVAVILLKPAANSLFPSVLHISARTLGTCWTMAARRGNTAIRDSG